MLKRPNHMSWGPVTVIALTGLLLVTTESSGRYVIPPGYGIPHIDRPEPTTEDHLDFGGLEVLRRNRVRHVLNFDRSPLEWAHKLLEVRIGEKEQWTPGDHYGILPEGYEGDPDRGVAFIAGIKLRFSGHFDPELDEPIRAVNRPQYTLDREGPHLVITRAPDWRWYFESPDGGHNWRITKLERFKHPGMFTELVYDHDLVTALVFPNGERARFHYEYRRPVEIKTPFSERIVLDRSAGGFIQAVEVHMLSPDREDSPQRTERNSVAHYAYERDGQGRITRFRHPSGQVYTCTYEQQALQEDETQKEIFTTIVRRDSDHSFHVRRDEYNRREGIWLIDHRQGGRDDDLKESALLESRRIHAVHSAWRTVERATPEGEATREVDEDGNPQLRVNPSGEVTRQEHDQYGRPVLVRSGGAERHRQYNEHGQVIRRQDARGELLQRFDEHGRLLERVLPSGDVLVFTYDERGFPVRRELGDRVMRFEFDDWGRLIQHVTERDGRKWIRTYTYDRYGRLARFSRTANRPLMNSRERPLFFPSSAATHVIGA